MIRSTLKTCGQAIAQAFRHGVIAGLVVGLGICSNAQATGNSPGINHAVNLLDTAADLVKKHKELAETAINSSYNNDRNDLGSATTTDAPAWIASVSAAAHTGVITLTLDTEDGISAYLKGGIIKWTAYQANGSTAINTGTCTGAGSCSSLSAIVWKCTAVTNMPSAMGTGTPLMLAALPTESALFADCPASVGV